MKKKTNILCLIVIMCTQLTGCGIASLGKAIANGFALILTLPIMILCILNGLRAIQASLSERRGTNTVTRFVRDIAAHNVYSRSIMWGGIQLINAIFFSLLTTFGFLFKFLYFLPAVFLIGYSITMQILSNRNKQRIKDSRTVTKNAGKAAGAVGAAAGAAVAVAAAPVSGGASLAAAGAIAAAAGTGAVVGGTVGKAADAMVSQMTDVQAIDWGPVFADFNKMIEKMYGIDLSNPTEFVQVANSAGFIGSTPEQIRLNACENPAMKMLAQEKGVAIDQNNVIQFMLPTLENACERRKQA